jgi:hypothetical protein
MKKDTKQDMNHSRNKMKRFPLILNLNRNEIVAGYQQRLHVTYSGQIVSGLYAGIEADMTTHSPQCMVECVLLFVLVFCVVFLFCLSSSCLVYSLLPVSLDYPLLVVPKTNTNNTIRLQFSYKQHSRRTEHRTRE